MNTFSTAAPSRANSLRDATGQGACIQSKWQLLKVIEDIRTPLGLKGTSLSLLRAMISFLRVDQIDASKDEAHICFASNASLAKRAHVSIQTIERHITKLVSLGLLERRSSGNGKRWARRDRHGQIILATGLSLLPLATRHAEFTKIAAEHHDQQVELRTLRDKCSAALATLKARLSPSKWDDAFFAKARKLLRRQSEKSALTELLADITAELGEQPVRETTKMRATAHANEGHKDTIQNPSVGKRTFQDIKVTAPEMEDAFPNLCAELKFARSQDECQRTMHDIAQQLGLGDTWFKIKEQGPTISFMVLGYILQRVDTITNYRGYAVKLAKELSEETINWRTLLRKPKHSKAA